MQLILIIFSVLLTIRISEEAYSGTSIKCSYFSSFNNKNNFDLYSNEKNVSIENLEEYSDKDKVTFTLYTKENPSKGELIEFNLNSVSKSHFNPKHPTRIIIHGWINNKDSSVNKVIRKAYFARGIFNVISVDWSSITTNVYSKAKEKVDVVGKKVAQFIDFLHGCAGMSTNTLYLIGHSLGAHVAGFAGKYVTSGRINTIFGLDPALPLFSITQNEKRLSSNDADYVEVIHTNGGKLGFYDPVGLASFYPNGGKKQPGCGLDASGTCSHSQSYKYFAETITNNFHDKFTVFGCRNFEEIKNNKCSVSVGHLRMGGEPSNNGVAKGIYYVKIN